MSGIGKIIGIVQQSFQGEVHTLAPKGLALHIALAFRLTDSPTVVGLWLIKHYDVAWPLMIGTIYLQFFSLWSVFRPSLHQIWGLSLILFHIATVFIMQIPFLQNCIWLALFFVNSPFRPLDFNSKQILKDLPLFNYFFR